MSKLEEQARELSKDFFELPIVKRFLMAKREYNKSTRLKKMREELSAAKKNLNNLPFEKQGEGVRRINQLKKEYDEDSLVVTYTNIKAEVDELLVPIRDLFRL